MSVIYKLVRIEQNQPETEIELDNEQVGLITDALYSLYENLQYEDNLSVEQMGDLEYSVMDIISQIDSLEVVWNTFVVV